MVQEAFVNGVSTRKTDKLAKSLGIDGISRSQVSEMTKGLNEQADEFRLLAEENRVNLRLIAPSRGLIHDINGIPLAVNEQNYRITLVREEAGDVEEALARLAQVVALPRDVIARTIEESARSSPFVPITVMDRVSWDDVARVTMNAPTLRRNVSIMPMSKSFRGVWQYALHFLFTFHCGNFFLKRREGVPHFRIGFVGDGLVSGTDGQNTLEKSQLQGGSLGLELGNKQLFSPY